MGLIGRMRELTYSKRWSMLTGGGGSSVTYTKTISTGPLVAGDNTIVHGMGYTNYSYELHDSSNIADVNGIYPAIADPTNAITINVVVPIPAGLTLIIRGSNT